MTDKLLEECLLPEDEVRMHSEYYYPSSKAMARRLDKILKAQLTKAIPIIRKAERERILSLMFTISQGVVYMGDFKALFMQALKGEEHD